MSAPPAVRAHPLADFLRGEAVGGVALVAAAVLALVAANSPLAGAYEALRHTAVGPLAIEQWVNDLLMALFFLGVGLEVKRELVEGALSHPGTRALPVLAAASGMVVPAIVYLAVAARAPGAARGWAIPAATDIAFAQAVLLLAGARVPPALRLFLTTVAIVDDIGAVLIIAGAYTAAISWAALAAAGAVLAGLVALNRAGVRRLWPYLMLAGLLWICVFRSGVHATVAGVLAAMCVPLNGGAADPDCPLHRLEHGLQPWIAYLVLPLFGFVNAGLALGGVGWRALAMPVPLGVALGLFLGKQAGVGLGIALGLRFGWGRRPLGTTPLQLYALALLAGIGFTMSLFIGGLAFPDPARMDEVKLGVLGGSLMSAAAGLAVLRFATRAR